MYWNISLLSEKRTRHNNVGGLEKIPGIETLSRQDNVFSNDKSGRGSVQEAWS